MSKQITIQGFINWPLVAQLQQRLVEAGNEKADELTLGINSAGGNIQLGLSIHNLLKASGMNITTVNMSHVDSIAGLIFAAGEKRIAMPNTRFLLHDVTWDFGSPNVTMNLLEQAYNQAHVDRRNIAETLASTCGRSADEIERAMVASQVLTATEAVEFGLATEVSAFSFDWSQPVLSVLNQ